MFSGIIYQQVAENRKVFKEMEKVVQNELLSRLTKLTLKNTSC